MQHGQYKFGPKMIGVVCKLECHGCRTRRAVMTTIAEPDLDGYLEFYRNKLVLQVGPCKQNEGKHEWNTSVLFRRSLAGHCMCEQCWPPLDGRPVQGHR